MEAGEGGERKQRANTRVFPLGHFPKAYYVPEPEQESETPCRTPRNPIPFVKKISVFIHLKRRVTESVRERETERILYLLIHSLSDYNSLRLLLAGGQEPELPLGLPCGQRSPQPSSTAFPDA